MAARRPFWKWRRWKSIGFCLWPPSTCIWNLKLKFQGKLDLCSGNHVVYRQKDGRTDGRTDKVNPVYPPSNFVGRGYKNFSFTKMHLKILSAKQLPFCPVGDELTAIISLHIQLNQFMIACNIRCDITILYVCFCSFQVDWKIVNSFDNCDFSARVPHNDILHFAQNLSRTYFMIITNNTYPLNFHRYE